MHKRLLCALCMRDVVWVCVVRVCVKAGKRCRTLILNWTGQSRKSAVRRVRGLQERSVVESFE